MSKSGSTAGSEAAIAMQNTPIAPITSSNAPIKLLAVLGPRHRCQIGVEFAPDRGQCRALVRSGSDGAGDAKAPIAVERTGHHVQHGIDDAPRGVAPDGPEQRRPGSLLPAAAQNAGGQREAQDHDQSRDDLSQTLSA